ncbi:hypothetical protein [Ideonella sp. B508-1]|uniref:hypothetical protein n=1 Tax=Ideonella sp. B508-1 TaxID=137716 RepID=UPI001F2FF48B|nr:hypothetical protein [Ideonella sp. B508-1]
MFRLGTRPESMRRSSPLAFRVSRASPRSVVMAIGTSSAFSSRRSAVTVMVVSLPASLALAGVASWAQTGAAGSRAARAARLSSEGRKDWDGAAWWTVG